MAIVIGTGGTAAANFAALVASIAKWTNRTDLNADIPTFIINAESRIATDLRVRQMLVSSVLTASDASGAELPERWLEFKTLSLDDGTPLEYLSPEDQLDRSTWMTGTTRYFSVLGSRVVFTPSGSVPLAARCLYYQRVPPLASSEPNWLLAEKPNVYLYAALAEACLFLKKPDEATYWGSLYSGLVSSMNAESDRVQHSGSVLRIRRR